MGDMPPIGRMSRHLSKMGTTLLTIVVQSTRSSVTHEVKTDAEGNSYTVAVPNDRVLSIEVVKRQIIRTPNNQSVNNHLEVVRFADREPSHKISHEVDGHQVQVDIINWENIDANGVREFVSPRQPRRPVEVINHALKR